MKRLLLRLACVWEHILKLSHKKKPLASCCISVMMLLLFVFSKQVAKEICAKHVKDGAWVLLAGFRCNHLLFNQLRGRVSNTTSWGKNHICFPRPPSPLVGDNPTCSVPAL